MARRLVRRLDDHLGPRYEEAFRMHLRRLVAEGEFGPDAVTVGPFWTRGRDQVESDAVVLAGCLRRRSPWVSASGPIASTLRLYGRCWHDGPRRSPGWRRRRGTSSEPVPP